MKREEMTAEIRQGTKCQFCGQYISKFDDYVTADGGCKGGIIYGHRRCCRKHSYSYENLKRNKKASGSKFQYGIEFETNSTTTDEERLQLWTWYKIICTSDCTVSEEFKSGINQALHGIKPYLQGISNIIDIAHGDNCGTHANVSLDTWTDDDMYYIRKYAVQLFRPMVRYMRDNMSEAERVQVFGRDFTYYASYEEEAFQHGDWLQIKDNAHCLEFRISRFKSVEQYSHLLMLYKEICLIINKIFLPYNTLFTAERAGKKIVDALDKHKSGTAKYFRAERNNNK